MVKYLENFTHEINTPKWKHNKLKIIKRVIDKNSNVGEAAVEHYRISIKDFEYYGVDVEQMKQSNYSIHSLYDKLKENDKYYDRKVITPLNNKINQNKQTDSVSTAKINVNKLKELLEKEELTKASVNNYTSSVRHMLSHFNTNDFNETLKDKDLLHEYLFNKEHIEKGRRNLYLIKLCLNNNLIDFDRNLFNTWGKEMIDLNRENSKNHLTISRYNYEDLIEHKNKVIDEKDLTSEKSLIAQLYTMNTSNLFRSDDAYTILIKSEGNDDENWIDLSTNKLHYNYFKMSKTQKKDEKKVLDLPEDFSNNVRKSLETNPRTKLFNMSKKVFDSYFRTIFGCTLREFRRSVETYNYNNKTTREFFENCDKGSHSVSIALRYYVDTRKPVKITKKLS